MENILKLVLIGHVTLGFVGLAAFWVPLLTRKGGAMHRRFGRIYRNCAYIALALAGAAVVLRSGQYLATGRTLQTDPAAFGFLLFLAYLALVTFVIVRYGVKVLQHKSDPTALATPLTRWLARSAIAASLCIIIFALMVSPPNRIILYALSPIGIMSGLGMLRYISRPPATPRAWLYEHLGSMIGGGIAFHTAFAVFGVNRLFDIGLNGWVAAIPWVAPAALGIPATIIWSRHYRRKFGETA
ncbi:MAG: hypothetical protein KJO35_06515 [Gammaproteobacteria bacterium]|nr:hypothetical protein [Gammaproteobacteria bacterium]